MIDRVGQKTGQKTGQVGKEPVKRICLVRHGETHQNFERVVQGSDPTQGRLTEKGFRQAALLGRHLSERPFEMVYSSTLERAVLTMSHVLNARKGVRSLPLAFADELREINLGVLHGQPQTKWREAIEGDPMAYAPPGGESWEDVKARVRSYFQDVVLARPEREILVVAHGGVNRGIIASLIDMSMAQAWQGAGVGIPQDNTCVNHLDIAEDGTLLRALINDTSHLLGAFPEAGGGQLWLGKKRSWAPQILA